MAIAILRRKRLFSGTLSTTANTIAFTAGTAPADGSAKETLRFTVTNKTGSAATVNVGVDNGAGLQAYILNAFSVPANDVYVHDASVDIMGGEKIQAWAGTASALDMNLFAVEANDT